MKFSEIKKIRNFCGSLVSSPDWREVVAEIESNNTDFTIDNVRFIDSDEIDGIQADELGNDEYMLGCFNSNFLAEVLEIDQDVIDAMQNAEAHEAIGKLIKSLGKLEELQREYASADGYGHHFNSYDFGEDELCIAGRMFHVFDNRR